MFKSDKEDHTTGRITWKALGPKEIYEYHKGMSQWAEEAQKKMQNLLDQERCSLNQLLDILPRKTSKGGVMEIIERTAGVLGMKNPLVLYCTQDKLSGLLGIEHVVSITVVPLYFKGDKFVDYAMKRKRILDEHNEMLKIHDFLQNKINEHYATYNNVEKFAKVFAELRQYSHNLNSTDIHDFDIVDGDIGLSLLLSNCHSAGIGRKALERFRIHHSSFWNPNPKQHYIPSEDNKQVGGLLHYLFVTLLSLNL